MSVDINAIRQRIALINQETAKVNNTRNQNIGQKQTLEKQCAELFAKYKEQFGVELNASNLETEVSKVTAEKVAEANLVESVLTALANNNYDEANSLLGIEVETPVVETVAPQPVVDEQPKVLTQPVQMETPVAPVQVETPVTPVMTQQVQMETPVAPVTPVATVTPVAPVPVTPSFTEPVAPAAPVFSQPVTPSQPQESISAPKSFGTITGNDFMSGVEDKTPKAPISALEGFTQPQQTVPMGNMGMPNLDVAAPAQPVGAPPVKTFGAIIGGTPFGNQ